MATFVGSEGGGSCEIEVWIIVSELEIELFILWQHGTDIEDTFIAHHLKEEGKIVMFSYRINLETDGKSPFSGL